MGEVVIDLNDINGELIGQPAKYAKFSSLYVMARSKAETCKLICKTVRAALDRKIREKHATRGTKITESGLSNMIDVHKEYVGVCEDRIQADEECGRLQEMCRSLDQRKDMLLALNANLRTEMED